MKIHHITNIQVLCYRIAVIFQPELTLGDRLTLLCNFMRSPYDLRFPYDLTLWLFLGIWDLEHNKHALWLQLLLTSLLILFIYHKVVGSLKQQDCMMMKEMWNCQWRSFLMWNLWSNMPNSRKLSLDKELTSGLTEYTWACIKSPLDLRLPAEFCLCVLFWGT